MYIHLKEREGDGMIILNVMR